MKYLPLLGALLLLQNLPRLEPTPDLHLATGVQAQRALERPIAGITVAAGPAGSIVPPVLRAFGLADVGRQTAMTADAVFHIGSISKYITAAVTMKLVEEGKLSLDGDIIKYVPEAPTQGKRVTIRQLLNHTSGIESYTSLPGADANEALVLSHEQILALVKDKPFHFEPGTSWRYSNTGYYLVGMAIERVTGQRYADYLRERVFRPLGMYSTSLCTSQDTVPNISAGHDVSAGVLVAAAPMSWVVPFAGGGICSTAADLFRWQRTLESGRFISRASFDLMRAATTLPDGTRIDYGLGMRIGSFEGRTVIGHTGSGGGFNAVVESFPAARTIVVVLTNTNNGGAVPLASAIARSAFELAPRPLDDVPVPADEIAALTGTFDSDDGSIENYPCADRICSRPPGATAGQRLQRQAPFVYAVDRDVTVRFLSPPCPSEWAFVYNGGLFADAKRRVRSR